MPVRTISSLHEVGGGACRVVEVAAVGRPDPRSRYHGSFSAVTVGAGVDAARSAPIAAELSAKVKTVTAIRDASVVFMIGLPRRISSIGVPRRCLRRVTIFFRQ